MDDFELAINQMLVSKDVLDTNYPINVKEKKFAQARLEKTTSESIEKAVDWLSRKSKGIRMMKAGEKI